ncbi:glucokinase [Pontibacillus halophilus JSM 076056 = DSM 19796]|uniref:Glucokinase n=1 Tax=Pontibacillus halophilus JSM 076056 = DSM 19796 TaxID=1385510 RepID=A0A0A5GFS3_9BACI|nr:ROK family glucokinase [Pontibacillus halophilus]KGX90869.1 glucokinase [Pontibacillus halophilus JSM 076056 = DSM 19796]
MGEKKLIGVDIGGTTVKIAFITQEGEIMEKWEIPTVLENEGASIVQDIADSIGSKQAEQSLLHEEFAGIGVGAPGFIEEETGLIYEAVNIGWVNFELSKQLNEATGYPVYVQNDANLAALGENWKGSGEQYKNVLAITLGTGVGGGIVVNGEILNGTNGMGGEIGHMTIETNGGHPCNCGKTGCLETVASATHIARLARERQAESKYLQQLNASEISAKDVYEAADALDEVAQQVLDYVHYKLGMAIANLAIALNPAKIVIGGGVSKAGDRLLNPVRAYFDQYALKRTSEAVEFSIASLGNDAGVIGGAYLVKQGME